MERVRQVPGVTGVRFFGKGGRARLYLDLKLLGPNIYAYAGCYVDLLEGGKLVLGGQPDRATREFHTTNRTFETIEAAVRGR